MAEIEKSIETYPRAELIEKAETIFKVKPEIVKGALVGNPAQELSIEEVKNAISDFKKKKVK